MPEDLEHDNSVDEQAPLDAHFHEVLHSRSLKSASHTPPRRKSDSPTGSGRDVRTRFVSPRAARAFYPGVRPCQAAI